MADIKLKKSDFFKKDNGKMSGISKEGTAAVMVDAAKLRQVMSWIDEVSSFVINELSSYDVRVNDKYPPNSQVVRLQKLNQKLAETSNSIKRELSSTLSTYTNTKVTALKNELNSALQNAINDLSAAADATIAQKVSRLYRYAGAVTYVEDLPADLTNSDEDIGTSYNILSGYDPNKSTPQTIKVNPGDNAVWDGTGWDILAGTIDVSNFAEKEDIERLGLTISEFANSLGRRIDEENERSVNADTILSSAIDDLSGTTEKSGIIFQFASKLYVDDTFATKQEVQDAIDQVHSHDNLSVLSGISANDITAWNTAEENAKDYTDGQITALYDVFEEKGVAESIADDLSTEIDEKFLKVDGSNAADCLSVVGAAGKIRTDNFSELEVFSTESFSLFGNDNIAVKIAFKNVESMSELFDGEHTLDFHLYIDGSDITPDSEEFFAYFTDESELPTNPYKSIRITGLEGQETSFNGIKEIVVENLIAQDKYVVRFIGTNDDRVSFDCNSVVCHYSIDSLDEYITESNFKEKVESLSSRIESGLAEKLDASEADSFAKIDEENCFSENQTIASGKTIYQQYEDSIPQRYITAKDLDEYDGLAEKREVIEDLDFLSSMNVDNLTVSSLIERIDTLLTILKND